MRLRTMHAAPRASLCEHRHRADQVEHVEGDRVVDHRARELGAQPVEEGGDAAVVVALLAQVEQLEVVDEELDEERRVLRDRGRAT